MADEARLQAEIDKLLEQWENDRRGFPSDMDWRAEIAESTLKLCIRELQAAVERSRRSDLTDVMSG
jgi:hypothetical protein